MLTNFRYCASIDVMYLSLRRTYYYMGALLCMPVCAYTILYRQDSCLASKRYNAYDKRE